MEVLADYGLFLGKALTVLVLAVLAAGLIAGALRRQSGDESGRLRTERLNRHYERLRDALERELRSRRGLGARRRRAKRRSPAARRVFVLDFSGDLRASAVESLREEITAVVMAARQGDEAVVRLESAGGLVHGYGLAASELARLRERGIALTVTVDRIAASGGYLMACVADRILAAPFAVVGSIGVVGQLPNFHRWLERHDIDYELHTAGEHKRTLTLFGPNSDEAREKFREDLEDTQELFKAFVRENRPRLAVDRVATGEFWYGRRALELGLVDELRTSDDYLLESAGDADLVRIRHERRMRLPERLAASAGHLGAAVFHRLLGDPPGRS